MSATPCLIVDIPGPRGPAGAAGAAGTNGINAWTTVALAFAMPAEGASVIVSVVETSWIAIGQKVFVGDPAGAARGTFEVVTIAGTTSVTLLNLADTATSQYLDNSAPATVFPISSQVSPAGLQGPAGAVAAGSAPDDATYITQTPSASLSAEQALSALATGLMHVTTATGVVTSVPLGVANTEVAPVDTGLTAGDAVFGTATGIITKTAANARIALDLVKGTANTNTPQVDDGAGLTNGELLRATATGIESVTNATVLAQLGVTGSVGAWAVYQNQQVSGTDGGTFTQTGWRVVPLNTEVTDASNIASIAGNTVTIAAAGTYRLRWRVPAYAVDRFQTALYNVTTTSIISYGSNAKASSTDTTGDTSFGEWRITIGGATQLQLWGWCELTGLNTGFGLANSFGGTEGYACLEIEKET